MDRLKGAWVVVPMYNEAEIIGQVVADLRQSFEHIVCVDDGSSDSSGAIARANGALVARHPVNLGQGAALQTGITFALRDPGCAYLVTFDADGQHRVSDAVAMVEASAENRVDVVLGSRFLREQISDMGRSRRLLLRLAVAFTRATSGLTLSDTHNGLRVFTRSAAKQLDITLPGMAHASEILGQIGALGMTWSEHPVTINYTDYSRAKGQTNINAVNIVLDLLARRLRSSR